MNLNHFIAKFEAIPEELWCVGKYAEFEEGADPSTATPKKCCAFGYCGARAGKWSDEAQALFDVAPLADDVNDGLKPHYQQPTPKQRVLAYLRDLREWSKPTEAP